MLKRFGVNFVILSLVIDIVFTLLALRAAVELREILPYGPDLGDLPLVPDYIYVSAALIWLLVFIVLGVYNPRRTQRAVDEIQRVLVALVFAALCLAGFVFFTFKDLSRFLFLYFFAIDAVLLLGWRVTYRIFRRSGNGRLVVQRNVLIVGAGEVGRHTAKTFLENAWMGLRLAGFADDTLPRATLVENLPVLGSTAEVSRVISEQDIDEVIIALPLRDYEKVVQLSLELQRHAVNVRVVPDYFKLALFRATVDELGGIPLINLRAPALNDYERFVKRIFDLIVGVLMIVVTLPLMVAVAIVTKLDSPGPIIYRQKRVGENGNLFCMYKFRTMDEDAEARLQEVIRHSESGHIVFKHPDDPRVTRVGRILRRASLDELPQLFNVLKGEMSLVGPRPELPWLVEYYEPWQRKRFVVPQGITGWWQINGRSGKHMHMSTEDDLYYIQNYSILLDLLILWKTIGVVLKRRGAF